MTDLANSAIHYHPKAFGSGSPNIMGRQSAGEGFLEAFVRHGQMEKLYCWAESKEHFECFVRQAEGWAPAGMTADWIPLPDLVRLANVGCVYQPDPLLSELAWNRHHVHPAAYSLCGVTHTLCSGAVLDGLGQLLIAPLELHDALICTSAAVRSTVDRILDDWGDYLRDRIGAKPQCRLQLPIIPLGVDCDKFVDGSGGQHVRARLRREWGIPADEVVVLFVGRLSYHAKANPVPMYLALEQVARESSQRLHLVQYGWFANDALREHFVAAAKCLCPTVNAVFVENRPELRYLIWHAADIFTSLSDNIQETFGLTPIEAMASGLPQVVSDWDGYRDTVRHGLDGFRVPTAIPAEDTGALFIRRHATGADNYDRYIGHVSQCVAVDVAGAVQAYRMLVESRELRQSLGGAARIRAREVFDWRVIIRQYQELWAELGSRRARCGISRSPGKHPLRPDPFRLFSHYASQVLEAATLLVRTPGFKIDELERLSAQPVLNLALPWLANHQECVAIVQYIGDHSPCEMQAVLDQGPAGRRETWLRSIGWLLKVDAIRLAQTR